MNTKIIGLMLALLTLIAAAVQLSAQQPVYSDAKHKLTATEFLNAPDGTNAAVTNKPPLIFTEADFTGSGTNEATAPANKKSGFTPPKPGDLTDPLGIESASAASTSAAATHKQEPNQFAPDLLEPVDKSKPRFDWDYWGAIAIYVAFAAFLITLTVLIFSSLVRYVRRMKISLSKLITLVGATAFILCGLFPPWLSLTYQGHICATSYDFILTPPVQTSKLDFPRLSVEWLCIAVATGTVLLMMTNGGKKGGSERVASQSDLENSNQPPTATEKADSTTTANNQATIEPASIVNTVPQADIKEP